MTISRLLSLAEVADLLRVSPHTVRVGPQGSLAACPYLPPFAFLPGCGVALCQRCGAASVTALPREVIEASARGWRIHPVRVRRRWPCLKNWPHLATTDIRQIESWARQYPDCNWGAVAGPDSGFFAVEWIRPKQC